MTATIGLGTLAIVATVVVIAAVLISTYMAARAGAGREQRRNDDADVTSIGRGPQRYRVNVRIPDGGVHRYCVVTAVDSKRAASIAYDEHLRRRPDATAHDVQVEHLGAVGRRDDGRVDLDDGDLFDQSEF